MTAGLWTIKQILFSKCVSVTQSDSFDRHTLLLSWTFFAGHKHYLAFEFLRKYADMPNGKFTEIML